MKTIGMIGGTGWVSTEQYYRLLNEEINKRLGGLNAAKILLYSFNYAEIDKLNRADNNAGVYKLVLDAARKLNAAGVECLMLCANTLHQFVDDLGKEIDLPVIHIADAAAAEIRNRNLNKVGLLGTRATMEMDFYTGKLGEAGIETFVPDKPEREFIHNVIMGELLKENFRKETKEKFISIINQLEQRGARGIVLGCTEIPLLIKQQDTHLPVFNTLELHAKAAAEFALL